MVAVAAGTALDFSSSVGKYESNPVLRNNSGQFSVGRGFAVKGGISVGLIVSQAWMMRHRDSRQVEKSATFVNFATAGLMTGVAIRNRGIPHSNVP